MLLYLKNMSERKSRVLITKNILEIIKRLIDNNTSLVEISRNLSISYATIKKIAKKISEDSHYVINFKNEIEKRGPNSIGGFHNCVSRIIDAKNAISQKEIANELEIFGYRASQSTVCRAIKKINYSRKRLVQMPDERNSFRIIENRRIFAENINNISDNQLFYLDECGFNKHTSRSYGYSPKNQKAIKTVSANRGQNISLLAMISKNGYIAFKIIQCPINGQILKDFLNNELLAQPNNVPRKTLIMDNVRFHHNPEVRTICNRKNIDLIYLPAYSPQLNPIEEFFSVVKANFKRLDVPKNSFDQIKSAIEVSILQVQPSVYEGIYRHMRRWLSIASAGEPMI